MTDLHERIVAWAADPEVVRMPTPNVCEHWVGRKSSVSRSEWLTMLVVQTFVFHAQLDRNFGARE